MSLPEFFYNFWAYGNAPIKSLKSVGLKLGKPKRKRKEAKGFPQSGHLLPPVAPLCSDRAARSRASPPHPLDGRRRTVLWWIRAPPTPCSLCALTCSLALSLSPSLPVSLQPWPNPSHGCRARRRRLRAPRADRRPPFAPPRRPLLPRGRNRVGTPQIDHAILFFPADGEALTSPRCRPRPSPSLLSSRTLLG